MALLQAYWVISLSYLVKIFILTDKSPLFIDPTKYISNNRPDIPPILVSLERSYLPPLSQLFC